MREEQEFIVALDQGTTSSRAIVYNLAGEEVSRASQELPVSFPNDAWVEQRAEDIWQTLNDSMCEAIKDLDPAAIRAIGVTNQRETTIAWDPDSGEVLSPAIVWQCRRSAEICETLRQSGLEKTVREKTGLVVDSYFSATKIAWMQENIPAVSKALENKKIAFGTVDTWVLYNLSRSSGSAPVVATEPSNACRTMLYSLEKEHWDDELLSRFSLSESFVAQVKPSFGEFCKTDIK